MGQALDPAGAGFVKNAADRVRTCSAAAAAIKSLASVSANEIHRLREYMRETAGCRSTAELNDWLDMIELFQIITEKAEIIGHEAEAVEMAAFAYETTTPPAAAAA